MRNYNKRILNPFPLLVKYQNPWLLGIWQLENPIPIILYLFQNNWMQKMQFTYRTPVKQLSDQS